MTTSYQVLSWRDIPAQIKATDTNGDVARTQLPSFFQQEIDRVAMAEGLTGSDAYLEAWEWSEAVEREGAAAAVAESVASEVADAWKRANKKP
jgi:hypothetical protein